MSLVVAVDFDGTVVDHRYPIIGADVPGSVEWLRKLADADVKIVLFTMRSGDTLDDAVRWYALKGIPLYGVNRNPDQGTWTSSPKAYAHVYVDDAAFGCPLRENPRSGGRPFVDWDTVGPKLLEMAENKQ